MNHATFRASEAPARNHLARTISFRRWQLAADVALITAADLALSPQVLQREKRLANRLAKLKSRP